MPVVNALTIESRLKRRIRQHLKTLGFGRAEDGALQLESDGKDAIRELHRIQRVRRVQDARSLIHDKFDSFQNFFASGDEIDPLEIRPRLEAIQGGTWQSSLFRLASLTWSIPVSQGFGRRMRFLVWDEQNGKLIGLIGLTDPVFNLKARDDFIGWSADDRKARLVNILDAYVLGALPPYNTLLGGKLVACLIRSKEVRDEFKRKYAETEGIISKEMKRPQLVLVSTSSALGRSSVYNRLKLAGTPYFESKGATQGWGHFHVPDKLFGDLRDYLREIGHPYADGHRFGNGPNWRLRTIRAAFDSLGFKADLLHHGIKREFFTCELATNARAVLRGENKRARYSNLLSVAEIADLAKDRWIGPRAQRRPDYKEWRASEIRNLLRPHTKSPEIVTESLAGD